MKRKIIGYRNSRFSGARPGEQYVHLAILECGHSIRVGHGFVEQSVGCPDCSNSSEAEEETSENEKHPLTQSSQEHRSTDDTPKNEKAVRSQDVRTPTSGC